MSRTYTFTATALYGGRLNGVNMYLQGFSAWNTKRVGWFKDGSKDYAGAVSIYFNLASVYGKTVESVKLAPQCSTTFAWAVPILYNQKATASTTDWSIPNYAYEVQCSKNGVIPELDVTAFGIPEHYAYVLGGYYRTYSAVDISGATLTVVTAETSKTITYNANGGSNAPSQTVLWGENSWDGYLSSSTPTRTGYSFAGWNTQSNGSGTSYASGAYIQISADTILYAQWTALYSVLNSASDANITENTTVTWTNYGSFTNKLRFIFGSVDSGEIAVSGTSKTYTLPSTWFAQIPNATSGTATVYLYTYVSGTLIGTSSRTFLAYVKSDVVPSIGTITATKVNPQWSLYLQGYSSVTIAVSGCAAGTGATIASYTITGQNLNYSENRTQATASATSNVLTTSGSFEYTATIKDSRGRTAEKKISITVTAYAAPSISSVTGVRCNSDGTVNQTTGTSIKATAEFTFSAVGSNTLTRILSYKKHTSGSYTIAETGINSGVPHVIAVGVAEISSSYDVKVEITDSLNNYASYVIVVPPVVGIAFGLKNDRARFGGPVEKAGLQVDWDAEFNGVLDVTQRRCYAQLPTSGNSAGWYRVLTLSGDSNDRPLGSPSFVIDITIVRQFGGSNNELHKVSLLAVYNSIAFANETSKSNTLLVDKIRYVRNGEYGYIDIHYDTSTSNTVTVCFDVKTYPLFDYQFVATTPTAVADSPVSPETEVTRYTFVTNNTPVGVTKSSNLLASGTIAESGTLNYTATEPCWVYLMFIMQANGSGSINVQIDNVNIINWSSGEAVPVNFSFLPIPLMKGNTLYVSQSSNRASTYSIFAMR